MGRKHNPELSARLGLAERPNAAFLNEDGSPKRLMWCSDAVRIGWTSGIDVPCPYTNERPSRSEPGTMLPPIGLEHRPKGGCCKVITNVVFGSKTARQISGDEAHSPGADSIVRVGKKIKKVVPVTIDAKPIVSSHVAGFNRVIAEDIKALAAGQKKSWCAVGIDTSMTAVSAVVFGYDGVTQSYKGPFFDEIRWTPEHEYMFRLATALKTDEMVSRLVAQTWSRSMDRTYVAIEEPWYYGAVKMGQSGHLKQQAEIAGVVKASLLRGGYRNIQEINNSQWHATLRAEGVNFAKAGRGAPAAEKAANKLRSKFQVKEWAIKAFGLPELPDLISKGGAKVPRPEGSVAKAIQPSDVYDAAAVCAWMMDAIEGM